VLNFLVTRLLGGQHHHHHDDNDDHHKGTHQQKNVVEVSNQKIIKHKLSVHEEDTNCPCCSTDPAGQLDRLHTMAEELEAEQETNNTQTQNTASEEYQDNADECGHPVHESNQSKESSTSPDDQATNNLRLMGLKTALAIGLHNFPEGLATFVAALSDPKVGAVLAVAIAIHNIPEGLCVALPIYYATGNRLKGFLWALLSGASEFVAALLGWAVLANSFSDDLYAVLFGLVSGMMVTISVRELLPTAHFYDPDDSVVTYSFIAGMILMALSLVLFVL
jgi:zinc transporter, ZIP family